jgi:hypothetical protein
MFPSIHSVPGFTSAVCVEVPVLVDFRRPIRRPRYFLLFRRTHAAYGAAISFQHPLLLQFMNVPCMKRVVVSLVDSQLRSNELRSYD